MALPDAWVEHLLGKLTLRYGEAFLRQYPASVSMPMLKADWAHVLDGLRGETIGYGLEHLPVDRPPNALQFREACLRVPEYEAPRLPAPKADPARVAKALESMRESMRMIRAHDACSPAQRMVNSLSTFEARKGRRLNLAQREALAAYREAVRQEATTADGRAA